MKLCFCFILACLSFLLQAQRPASRTGLKFALSDTAFQLGSTHACNNIIFEPASVFIQAKSLPYVDSMAMIMQKYPAMQITVKYVHFEWPSYAEDNYSFDRAMMIAEHISSKGIEMNRILRKAVTRKTDKTIEELNKQGIRRRYTVEFTIIAL